MALKEGKKIILKIITNGMGSSSGFSNISEKKIDLSILVLGVFLPLTKNVEFLPPRLGIYQ